MLSRRAHFVLATLPLALVVALGGCSDSHGGDDAGGILLMDSGPGAITDAGPGATTDAGPGAMADAGPGAMADAGPGGGFDAGPPTDGGGTVGIDCMGMTCDPRTETCCVTGGLGTPASASCIPNTEMCMGATADCDGPEDCMGDVCCARASLGGITVSCEPSPSTCGSGGFGEFELCHVASDCSGPTDMCCPVRMGGFSAMYCSETCFGGPPMP